MYFLSGRWCKFSPALTIDLQVREISEMAWKHIVETVIYHCDPDDSETISSEFDRDVDNHYYSMKEKFEKISELLKEWKI